MTYPTAEPSGRLSDNPLIRSFIAIKLGGAIRKWIDPELQKLRFLDRDGAVRWVDPNNIHLTLQFLGERDPAVLHRLASRLVSDLEKFPPFPISPGLAGCFPNIQHPKVIWIGLNESKSLAELAKQVRISCGGELKDLDNKPFAPHLTLGRVRMGATPGFLSDWMKGYGDLDNNSLNPGAIVQHVDSVVLYKSELKPQGPNYSELAIIPLMK